MMEETQLVVSGYRQGNSIRPRDDRRLVTSLKSSKYTSFFSAALNSGGLVKPAGLTIGKWHAISIYMCVSMAFFKAYESANRWLFNAKMFYK